MENDCIKRTTREERKQQYLEKKAELEQQKEELNEQRREICKKLGHAWEQRIVRLGSTGRHTYFGTLYRSETMERCVICDEFHCRPGTVYMGGEGQRHAEISEEQQKMLDEVNAKNTQKIKKIEELEEEVKRLEKTL